MIQWLCRGATAFELCLGFVIAGWILTLSQTFTFSGKREDIFTRKLKSTPLHRICQVPWPLTITYIPFCLYLIHQLGLLVSMLEKATNALCSHPIFGDCQSNSHSNTFNRTSLSAFTARDTKTRAGMNLFLRPPQSSAGPRWTARPAPPLESIVLPSRGCWKGARMNDLKRGQIWQPLLFLPSPFCREVAFMDEEQKKL